MIPFKRSFNAAVSVVPQIRQFSNRIFYVWSCIGHIGHEAQDSLSTDSPPSPCIQLFNDFVSANTFPISKAIELFLCIILLDSLQISIDLFSFYLDTYHGLAFLIGFMANV